jgi:hypothetical protein
MTLAQSMGIINPRFIKELPAWKDIPRLRKEGADPYEVIDQIVATYGPENRLVQECIRAIGAGSSPWIQLSQFLLNAS